MHLCQTYRKCLIKEKNYLKATARQERSCVFWATREIMGKHGNGLGNLPDELSLMSTQLNIDKATGCKLEFLTWHVSLKITPTPELIKYLTYKQRGSKIQCGNFLYVCFYDLWNWFRYRVSNRRFNGGLLQLALAADVVKCEQQMVLITYVGR